MKTSRQKGQHTVVKFDTDELNNIKAFLLMLAAEAKLAIERMTTAATSGDPFATDLGLAYWHSCVKCISWINHRAGQGIRASQFKEALKIVNVEPAAVAQ